METMLKAMNEATNLVAVALCIVALAFVAAHQPAIAEKMVIGALAFAGGGAASRVNTRVADQKPSEPEPPPTDVVSK